MVRANRADRSVGATGADSLARDLKNPIPESYSPSRARWPDSTADADPRPPTRLTISVTRYTGRVAEEPAYVDTSALDHDDSIVARIVADRWDSQDLAVAQERSGAGNFLRSLVSPTRAFGAPDAEYDSEYVELTRRVRLSEMARRNNATYQVIQDPGASVFGFWRNPVLSHTIFVAMSAHHGGLAVTDSFAADETDRPSEWGTYVLQGDSPAPGEPPMAFTWRSLPDLDTTTPRFGQYLVVRLPSAHPAPHLVLIAARSPFSAYDLPLAVGEGGAVAVEASFDQSFRTYVPRRARDTVPDLLTPGVRAALLSLPDWHIEILPGAVVFLRPGVRDWDRAEPWQAVGSLRGLVAEVLYPRIGEYVDR